MPLGSIGSRLTARMRAKKLHAAEVARRAHTTEATISNWCLDRVKPEHAKASMLLNIATAVDMDPRELLLGEPSPAPVFVSESAHPDYISQRLRSDALTLAFQLAAEVSDELRARNLTLPPEKLAELTRLAYEMLDEGLPRAKVLRFVLAAAA